ncbi:hypothetical protein NT6N_07190 [Oceaniferula spumae]|uniref:Uncharacterized protein n=1 Tax=Oceaniferula spumae TaxID=2979115 RepID=A0AAT9FI61_9BACT
MVPDSEQRFSALEDRLRNLVPPAVSQEGQQRLEDTVDQLAGLSAENDEVSEPAFFMRRPWQVAAAITLTGTLAWTVYSHHHISTFDPSLAASIPEPRSEMVLLTSTNRIDIRQDDGLIVPEDGSAPHYRYRYHVTDEARVRDPKTGTIVTLRQPREEIVTVPVTQF